jgi:hypothetical protein
MVAGISVLDIASTAAQSTSFAPGGGSSTRIFDQYRFPQTCPVLHVFTLNRHENVYFIHRVILGNWYLSAGLI